MNSVEGEDGPRFGPLRAPRPSAARSDHGRGPMMFNLLAVLCALIFTVVVILAIIQFVRLAGESDGTGDQSGAAALMVALST